MTKEQWPASSESQVREEAHDKTGAYIPSGKKSLENEDDMLEQTLGLVATGRKCATGEKWEAVMVVVV